MPSGKQWGFILAVMLCLVFCDPLLTTINEKRLAYRLTQNKPLENAPPSLVLATTALGGFRGILIDYLWLRAARLQKEGKYYEIVQLCDWIGQLEPRIPEVWAFNAHNMAYNISAALSSEVERWRWIQQGIKYLRDQGIPANQNTPRLYWELAWIILHKVGTGSMDEYREYYRKCLVTEMHTVLGEHPDLQALAQAPKDRPSLEKIPGMERLLNQLKQEGVDIFHHFFMLTELPPQIQEHIQQAFTAYPEAATVLKAYLRATHLRQVLKMEPEKMLALAKYGNLDWRTAATVALYWVEEGMDCVKRNPKQSTRSLDTHYDIVRYTCLRQNFESGRLIIPNARMVVSVPNFTVLESLHNMFEQLQKKRDEVQGLVSHETFLHNAVMICYMYDQRNLAQKYYHLLGQKFDNPLYRQSMDEYAITQIGREAMNYGRKEILEADLIGFYYRIYYDLLLGIVERAAVRERMVEKFYRQYCVRHGDPEGTNAYEQPKPREYFRVAAAKQLKEAIGEENFAALAAPYPQLKELAAREFKEKTSPSNQTPE